MKDNRGFLAEIMNIKEKVTSAFIKRYKESPQFIVRAPGRVNLIGEHTDYNDGFVLPMAIDRAIWVALRPRDDLAVKVSSLDFSKPCEFSLEEITHGDGWGEYLRGMAWSLQESDYPLQGWEGVLASDIPVGAGLSSSAALELATARSFWAVNPWEWDATKMARLAQKTENEWLGVKTGIMDQMIVANGKEDHALLIDCRDLSSQLVPLPTETAIVVLDTATRRGLIDSAYNERVSECQIASEFFSVDALRDISLSFFENHVDKLDPLIARRAHHVVSENERTLEAATAMKTNDRVKLGQLINASHISLRDDYEVSSEELNIMVEIANTQEGCFGARMTGAGFGGCAIALVEKSIADSFAEKVSSLYRAKIAIDPQVYICHPSNGAELVKEL